MYKFGKEPIAENDYYRCFNNFGRYSVGHQFIQWNTDHNSKFIGNFNLSNPNNYKGKESFKNTTPLHTLLYIIVVILHFLLRFM